jgi:Domain of unknown function (DUF4960)/Domain of unknown function (DUF5018)
MKKINFINLSLLFSAFALVCFIVACDKEDPKPTPSGASIISFAAEGVNGTINESAKTITLELPPAADITKVTPTITLSAGATISPASGVVKDFTNPVTYTVTDATAQVSNAYTVTMKQVQLKKFAFIGVAAANTAAAWDALDGTDYDLNDDQTAAAWFEANINNGTTSKGDYFSIEQVANGADLSQYDAIWIQFDGGWWGGEVAQFPNNTNHCIIKSLGIGFDTPCAALASSFSNKVKAYYEAGGNLLLGNYAGSIVDEIGVVSSPDFAPNNSFGGVGIETCCTQDAWGARWSGDASSALFNGIVTATDPNCLAPFFILLESGTEKKNRSNQYNLNFGPWAPNGDTDPLAQRLADWKSKTGGIIHMENCGQNEPLYVEWPATGNKGRVFAILGGTYDWYTGTAAQSNNNQKIMTKNALTELAK